MCYCHKCYFNEFCIIYDYSEVSHSLSGAGVWMTLILHIQVPCQEKCGLVPFVLLYYCWFFFPFLFLMDGWSVASQHEGHSFVQMNVRIIDSGTNLLPASEANGLPSGFFKRVCALLMMSNPHRKSICVLFWTVLSLLHRLYRRRNGPEFLRTRKKQEDAAKFRREKKLTLCVPCPAIPSCANRRRAKC